jgi:hypothetical protein
MPIREQGIAYDIHSLKSEKRLVFESVKMRRTLNTSKGIELVVSASPNNI